MLYQRHVALSWQPTIPSESAFVNGILANPDDDGPRLVYADWLEERGNPRGELIHLQCQLAESEPNSQRFIELESRQNELLKEHGSTWRKHILFWEDARGRYRAELIKEQVLIGRHADADVIIQGMTISRRHATLFRTSDGYVLDDLGSLHGTFLRACLQMA